VLVDVRNRKTQRIWSARAELAPQMDYGWFSGADIALAAVACTAPSAPGGPSRRQVLRIDGPGLRSKAILEAEADGFDHLEFDPNAARAVLAQTALPDADRAKPDMIARRWLLLDKGGPPRELCSGTAANTPFSVTWLPTGQLAAAMRMPQAGEGQKPVVRWRSIEPETLTTKEIERPSPPEPRSRHEPLGIAVTEQAAQRGGVKAPVRLLWLETSDKGEQPTMLLCADGDWGVLSPDRRQVVWSARGAAWIAPITPVSLARYRDMRTEAERIRLMQNGKQAALAAIMYAQDHGETLPSRDLVPGALLPYLKDPAVVADLVYALEGGRIGDYSKPATTEMGHIPGYRGRAVIFLDGHVEWRAE